MRPGTFLRGSRLPTNSKKGAPDPGKDFEVDSGNENKPNGKTVSREGAMPQLTRNSSAVAWQEATRWQRDLASRSNARPYSRLTPGRCQPPSLTVVMS